MTKKKKKKKRARLYLKVPIDETIGQSSGNESLEENMHIFRVP